MEEDLRMISKQVHCGQYRRYGDFFRVWEITTEETDRNKVLEYCKNELSKKELPEAGEYKKNIRHGGKEDGNAHYYFKGYYSLEEVETGWKFTVCEPYCD